MPPTHAERLAEAVRLLDPVTDTPRLDAEILLAAALGIPRARLLAGFQERVEAPRFDDFIARRLNYEPLAYILGEWEFFSLPVTVRPPLLVPRPETEHLVEAVLDHYRESPIARPLAQFHVLEVGVGTGCVSVAIAVNAPEATIVATDINPLALETAARNAARHNVAGRVALRRGDLFDALDPADGPFHVICSNPPYIEDGAWLELSPVIRLHEDRAALLAGSDGLDIVRRLIDEAPRRLASGGLLAFEIGMGQDATVEALLHERGYRGITFRKDLAGINRIATATLDQ